MFLAATTRPRLEYQFDGLIGIWCIVEPYEAKRNSRHHIRGEVYDKACTLDATKYREVMMEHVFPAAWAKMPWLRQEGFEKLFCQQDGARPHTGKDNVNLLNEFGRNLPNATCVPIEVVTQPAQSYDSNVNDLAFFSAHNKRFHRLQKLQTVDDMVALVKNVQDAYNSFSPITLERMWRMKIKVLELIIACEGGNEYKLPHHKDEE
eukprot:SAG31_NODE_3444_length_4259_cov_5.231250_3_plen_206_part_00